MISGLLKPFCPREKLWLLSSGLVFAEDLQMLCFTLSHFVFMPNDIKSNNVLIRYVDAHPIPKLCDFERVCHKTDPEVYGHTEKQRKCLQWGKI